MDSRMLLRQLLRTPSSYRTIMTPALRPQSRTFALLAPRFEHPRYLSLPRVIQPSFWTSMVPRPFRSLPSSTPKPSKEWNPATPYIILGLLVGSQAIQVLWLKRDRAHDMRRAEAKMGLLREVIEKVQRGEDVDVEKVLGTGDVVEEGEWKEVLKEIEEEEVLFRSKKKRRAIRQAAAEEAKEAKPDVGSAAVEEVVGDGALKVEEYKGARFY